MSNIKEKALEYHAAGFNCAQSVLAACKEYTGLDDSAALAISAGFGGGLRSGEISYEDAVYLWDKDSTEVIAVRADSYQTVQDNIVSFTDDGNVTHTCYILDTKID